MGRPSGWRSWIGWRARARGEVLGTDHHLQVARLEILHAALEHDATAVDEQDVGEDVLDFFALNSLTLLARLIVVLARKPSAAEANALAGRAC